MTEDEMAGWHHQFNGHVLGQTLGDGEGQGGLACCSPWGHKDSDTIGRLTDNKFGSSLFSFLRRLHAVSHSGCADSLIYSCEQGRVPHSPDMAPLLP